MTDNLNLTKIEIYLNEDNLERLKQSAKKFNSSYSEIISDALDLYDLKDVEEFKELLLSLTANLNPTKET